MVKFYINIMDIGKAIKRMRVLKELNQTEFGQKVGISQTYLSLIEKGHRRPSLEVLESISKFLDTPLAILFWFGISEEDISEDKKEAYNLIRPAVDKLINSFV